MKKLCRSVLSIIILLGMLMMLTICSSIFVSSTHKSSQNQESNPIILHTNAENITLQWNTTWGGANYDAGYDGVVDANGYLYCIGDTNSIGAGKFDFGLVKFAPTGKPLWNTTWGGVDDDSGQGIAVDTNGFLYCAGCTESFGAGSSDFALVKFAPNGTKFWNTTWGGANTEYGRTVAVDTSGFVYFIGTTLSYGAGDSDLALVKFAPNSTRLWNRTWGGAFDDYGQSVAVDATGDIYCVGYTRPSGASNYDLALVKFAPTGTQLWNRTWGGVGIEYGNGVAVDATGSVYSIGYTNSFGVGGYDLALIKFASDGTQLWNTTWGGPSNEDGGCVVVDASNSPYCIGSTDSYGVGAYDFALVKYAPNGTQLWNTTWGGANYDFGYGVVLDASGFLYGIGYTNSFGAGNLDLALVQFKYPVEEPGTIPGFELIYILISLLALSFIVQRRRFYRTLS